MLAEIDPVEASKIQIFGKYIDRRLWAIILRAATSPARGFKKTKDGLFERVTVETNDKARVATLMNEDGYTLEEIASHLGTDEEAVKELLS